MDTLYKPVNIETLSLAGNLFLAPVAGYSDKVFRSLCTDWGADFTYTEMVSSEALIRDSAKTGQLLERSINEKYYAVQIFGANPSVMAQAAEIICTKYCPDCIDINAGCPMPKITKTGAGSALMLDIKNLYSVVSSVVKAAGKYGKPVSLKIRSGWSDTKLNWKEAAAAAIDAGVKALTIHPRTRQQCYSGKADVNILCGLVQFVKPYGIPVFGSGDIFRPEDAERVLKLSQCAGIMFARGAMGNPFIFKQTKELLTLGFYNEISYKEKIETGLKELMHLCSQKGEAQGCREMRKRFSAYTKGLKNASELREHLVRAETIQDYLSILNSYQD